MKNVMYAVIASVLLFGLLVVGGYIGSGYKVDTGYSPTSNMAQLVTGNENAESDNDTSGGVCASCRWY